jgi:hypothetical protein
VGLNLAGTGDEMRSQDENNAQAKKLWTKLVFSPKMILARGSSPVWGVPYLNLFFIKLSLLKISCYQIF